MFDIVIAYNDFYYGNHPVSNSRLRGLGRTQRAWCNRAKKPCEVKNSLILCDMRDLNDQKDRILLAVLPHVAFDGWTDNVFDKAIGGKNIKLIDVMQAFPNGVKDVLVHFSDWGIRQVQTRMGKKRLINMKVRDRVFAGVEAWLDIMTPHREAVRAALKYGAHPLHAGQAARSLHNLSSAIWYEAGDNATDFNYYTKRLLLSGVVSTTVMFWLNDDSDSYEKTREFLAARIDNVLKLGKTIAQAKSFGKNAKSMKNIYEQFQKFKKA